MKQKIIAVFLIASSANSYAVLGGQVTNRIGLVTQQNGSVTAYQSQEFGTKITEYTSGGKVFAVKWSGPTQPDLRTLYGPYFSFYENAQLTRRGSSSFSLNGNLVVKSGPVIISHSGHMGAMQGYAYIFGALPSGFDPATLAQ